jgi:hypothetical protein
MKQFPVGIFLIVFLCFSGLTLIAQENDLSGIEISIDQDFLVDFLHDDPKEDDNYAVSLRIGIYGAYANHVYLGLPFVRQKIDGFLLDGFLEDSGFREESVSHNFVFTVNGFSPLHISDETTRFQEAIDAGYRLIDDRPFSSFTGFRSTRRVQGYKLYVHSAKRQDLAFTTSFTFGFASFGLAQSIENLLGANRPDGNLWDRDKAKTYPTGQVIPKALPLFMYSISAEAVLWRPMKKVLLQIRPELNLGYYTNIGLGFDFGKVLNVERLIDNLSYTDTHNPGTIAVSDEYLALSFVGGATARAVIYNAHLNGLFSSSAGHYIIFGDTKKFLFEAYIGAKVQLFQKFEFSLSVNGRSAEFSGPAGKQTWWGTLGFKYLLAPPGEGCYD